MNIAVYGAASSLIDDSYKKAGIELGREMAKRGHGLVFGGGNNGMMGASAEGVYENRIRKRLGVRAVFIICSAVCKKAFCPPLLPSQQVSHESFHVYLYPC